MSKSIKKVPTTGVYGNLWNENEVQEWTFRQVEHFISAHLRENVDALEHLKDYADRIARFKFEYLTSTGLWAHFRPNWDKSRNGLCYEVYLDPYNAALYVVIKGFTEEVTSSYDLQNGSEVVLFGVDETDGKISHCAGYESIPRGAASAPSNRCLVSMYPNHPKGWMPVAAGESGEMTLAETRDFILSHSLVSEQDSQVWFEFFVLNVIGFQSRELRTEGLVIPQPFDPEYDETFHEAQIRCEINIAKERNMLRIAIKPFSDEATPVDSDRAKVRKEYLYLDMDFEAARLGGPARDLKDPQEFTVDPVLPNIKWKI